jgi:hypothetical protein
MNPENQMTLYEALDIISRSGIKSVRIDEKRIPKYIQRRLEADERFKELGISIDEYMTRAEKALASANVPGLDLDSYGMRFDPERKYMPCEYRFRVSSDGEDKESYEKGEVIVNGMILFSILEGNITLWARTSRVDSVSYGSFPSMNTTTLRDEDPDYPMTSSPEEDVARAVKFFDEEIKRANGLAADI